MTLPERLHGLDAVRGFALLLGVIVHASMSFLPGAQYFWTAHDSDPSTVLSLAFYVPHMFRMLLFFLLAGFFGRMAYERLGLKAFAKDRWKRIGIPLLVGSPLVLIAIIAVLAWGAMLANGGELPKESPPGPAFTPDSFPLTHLWFLYVLMLCYAAAVCVRKAIVVIDSKGRLRAVVDRLVRVLADRVGPALLALPLCAALFFQSKWFMWFGIPTPDQSLYPNLPALVGFGTAFAFGWLLQRQQNLIRGWERPWPLHLSLAVIATSACLGVVGVAPKLMPASQDGTTLAYAACYGFAAWNWTFALIGLALRFLSGFSPVRRYLADASYWIYLIHLPLVMALQVVAVRLDWSWMLKFPLLLVVAFAIMLSSYHVLVRYSFIGATLNGRRKERRLALPQAQDRQVVASESD